MTSVTLSMYVPENSDTRAWQNQGVQNSSYWQSTLGRYFAKTPFFELSPFSDEKLEILRKVLFVRHNFLCFILILRSEFHRCHVCIVAVKIVFCITDCWCGRCAQEWTEPELSRETTITRAPFQF